jgi:hypothetical protein
MNKRSINVDKLAYSLFEIKYTNPDERPLYLGSIKLEFENKARELCKE